VGDNTVVEVEFVGAGLVNGWDSRVTSVVG